MEALCALGKAHARAKALGVFGIRSRTRHNRVPRLTYLQETLKARKHINWMIELETRWRLRQLGVPYTDDMRTRFPPFDMASKHRMEIETEHNREEDERRTVERERKRAEELAAKQAATADREAAGGE